MSLILLEAGYGAEIEICAEGYDEKVAVHKLVEFVEQKFGELEWRLTTPRTEAKRKSNPI